MATTKIPLVYGTIPSKFVFRRTSNTKSLNRLSARPLDKAQGFIRYHFESDAFDDYPDFDDSSNLNNDYETAEHDGLEFDCPVFPTGETLDQTNTKEPTFSSEMKPNRYYNTLSCEGIQHSKCHPTSYTSNKESVCKYDGISYNFANYILNRGQGCAKNQQMSVRNEYGTFRMIQNCIFKEHLLSISNVNKIFCSKWLTNEQIVMGTKCNQLLLYNINSKKTDYIPILSGHSSGPHSSLSEQCGIHALELNPSKTLMATGAQNSNEIAVYSLPTLDPVCMGEKAHVDWIFDLCWLDDQFLVSASRDKTLALWRIDESLCKNCDSPLHGYIEPLSKKKCNGADKVRALLFNPNYKEIVALSLNAKIHVWDATAFKQVMSQKLELANDNVCMTKTENCSMYAVGSKCHVTLIDPRTLQSISKIDTRKSGPNIRSMSFKGSLLTIGTGTGDLMFYDVKAGRYLEGSESIMDLKCSKCTVSLDDSASPLQYVPDVGATAAAAAAAAAAGAVAGAAAANTTLCDSAVYTHCYDWSGTRLFAAGGPLSAAFKGCYAALWC